MIEQLAEDRISKMCLRCGLFMFFKMGRKPHLAFSAGFVTPSSPVSIRTSAARFAQPSAAKLRNRSRILIDAAPQTGDALAGTPWHFQDAGI
jgi:hypothetical protein